jgi:hypothetical protein
VPAALSRIVLKEEASGTPAGKVLLPRPAVSRELVPLPLTDAERQERNARVFALLLRLLPAFHGEASTATSLGRGRR